MNTDDRLRVALVQLDAGADVERERRDGRDLADEAAGGGARLVALPEYLQYRGSDDGYRASARPIPGPWTDAVRDGRPATEDAWILVGSLAETSADPARPYNTSVLIAPGRHDRRDLPQDPPLRRRPSRTGRSTASRIG